MSTTNMPNNPTSVVAVVVSNNLDFIDDTSDLLDRPPASLAPLKNGQSTASRKKSQIASSMSTNNNIKREPQKLTLLLKNQRFWSRILILFIFLFLWILCCIYTHAQILKLTLSNFLCPTKTLKESHQHSIDNNMSHQCWRAKDFTVNEGALWSNAAYGVEWDLHIISIFKYIAFLILCIAFTICIIHIIIVFIIDIIKYRHYKLGQTHYEKQIKKQQQKPTLSSNSCFLIDGIRGFLRWYFKTFVVDSGEWCILSIFREIFEIALQSQALLLYNGTNIFNLNEVFVAKDPKYIKLFAVFIFSNSIINGMLWIFYAFIPTTCHGLMFEFLIYSFDAIFDIFYTLFPLIIVLNTTKLTANDGSLRVAVASLQTDTQIVFWATFVPMVFLFLKFWSLSYKSSISMRRYYAKIYVQSLIDKQNKDDIDIKTTAGQLLNFPSAPSETNYSPKVHSPNVSRRPTMTNITANIELQKIFDLVMMKYSDIKEQDNNNNNSHNNNNYSINEQEMVYIDYNENNKTAPSPIILNAPSLGITRSLNKSQLTSPSNLSTTNLSTTNLSTPINIQTPILGDDALNLSNKPSISPIGDSPEPNGYQFDINMSLAPDMDNIPSFNQNKVHFQGVTPNKSNNKNTLNIIKPQPMQLKPNAFSTTSWILRTPAPKSNVSNGNFVKNGVSIDDINKTQNDNHDDGDDDDNDDDDDDDKKNKTQNIIQQSMMKQLKNKWDPIYTKKLSFLLIAILFIIYGFVILFGVLSHFRKANVSCNLLVKERGNLNKSNIFSDKVMDLLENDSELFLFDFCEFPVYPFGFNHNYNTDICQCRNFRISFDDGTGSIVNKKWSNLMANDMKYYFNINIVKVLMNALKKWYMLEKVQISNVKILYGNEEVPFFNFTSDMFLAQRLQVFQFKEIPTFYIDDGISNWKELVFFSFTENDILSLPKTFDKLTNLAYLEWGKNCNYTDVC